MQRIDEGSLQKSLQSANFCSGKGRKVARKSLKIFGSSGRTRTYNPSVNSPRNLIFGQPVRQCYALPSDAISSSVSMA